MKKRKCIEIKIIRMLDGNYKIEFERDDDFYIEAKRPSIIPPMDLRTTCLIAMELCKAYSAVCFKSILVYRELAIAEMLETLNNEKELPWNTSNPSLKQHSSS